MANFETSEGYNLQNNDFCKIFCTPSFLARRNKCIKNKTEKRVETKVNLFHYFNYKCNVL